MAEIEKFSKLGDLCVAGDFNISFSGFPYPSNAVIKESKTFFDSVGLKILTADISDSADHIATSQSLLCETQFAISRTLFDKKITDHNLVTVEFPH